MTVATGSWIGEHCSSTGYDALTLIGNIESYSTFISIIPAGAVWYSIEDGNGNREAGIGDYDGANTIQRSIIHATLENGVYTTASPTPILLTGSSTVSCTMNSKAYQDLVDGLAAISVVPTYREYDLDVATQIYYKGWSETKSAAGATWKIIKGNMSSGSLIELHADGDLLFDNIWNDRLTKIYS